MRSGPGLDQIERAVAHARVRPRRPRAGRGRRSCPSPRTARPRQQLERGVHQLARQRVQHDVHALPAVASRNRSSNSASREEAMCASPAPALSTPHFPGLAVANTSAPRCRASCTAAMPDPARRRVHQQPLARRRPAQIDQRVVGRQEHDRHRRRLRERPALGHPHEQPPIGDRDRAERARQQTHHPVAGRESSTPGPTSSTTPAPSPPTVPHPGTSPARSARRGSSPPPRAPPRAPARLERLVRLGGTAPARDPRGCPRGRSAATPQPRGHAQRPVARPARAGRQDPSPRIATCGRPRGSLARQRRRQRPPRGRLAVDVDQHEPPGVLRLRRAHQPPYRAAGQIRRLAGARRPRPASPPPAAIPEPLLRKPRLHQPQHVALHARTADRHTLAPSPYPAPPAIAPNIALHEHDLRQLAPPSSASPQRGQIRIHLGRHSRVGSPRATPEPSRPSTCAPERRHSTGYALPPPRPPGCASSPRRTGIPGERRHRRAAPRTPGALPASPRRHERACLLDRHQGQRSSPHGVRRTRSADAPGASDSPRSTRTAAAPARPSPVPVRNSVNTGACSAASSNAGCTAEQTAPIALLLGQRDLGEQLSPRRQTARSPWNAGPYSKPVRQGARTASSTPSVAAPAGGQLPPRASPARRQDLRRARLGGEHAAGMSRPCSSSRRILTGRVVRGASAAHGPRPVSSGSPTATCSCTPPSLRQHQRRLQRQLPHAAAADPAAGVQRELEERRAGQQHDAHTAWSASHGWVSQRQAAGEQPPLALGQRDRRAQQRVLGRALADAARSPRPHAGSSQ